MKKKVIVTLSSIVLITIGIKFLLPSSNQEVLKELDEDSFFELPEINEENLSKLALVEEFDMNDSEFKAISITLDKEDSKIMEEIKSLYTELDKDTLLKELPNKHSIQPTLAVQVSSNSISSLEVGDTIQLPNIGQVSYEAIIKKKVTHDNGSVSVTGNLTGSQNSQYSVVFTEGKKTSYASFTTPEGAFEIETVNGQGYVYSVQDMENQLIDPNKEDILLPPEDEKH